LSEHRKKPKPKTLLNETVIIRQLVNFALKREWLQRDPLKNFKLRKVKPGPQPCWTLEEVEAILAAAIPGYRNALTILAETGMRMGELKHLTWQDVDLGPANVLLVRPKEGWKPKTGDQHAIPISPRLHQLLKSLIRRSQWVVTSPRIPAGVPELKQVSERRLLQSLKTTLKKLGLPGHLHTFRHSFISSALANGTTESTLRSWVGHVDAETLKTYTHVHDRISQAEMQRLAGKKLAASALAEAESPNESSEQKSQG
jgi:integrase